MKKSIDRRLFLKGLGASAGVAGTFFSAPEIALGQSTEAPTRVVLVALQHGWGRDKNFDRLVTGSEFDFALPPPLTGLNAIRDQLVVVDGLRGTLWGNAHDVSYSDIFTAAVPWEERGSQQLGQHFPEPTGPSLDWLIGNHHNKQVLRMSARYRSWGKQYHPLCFDDQATEQAQYTSSRAAYDALIGPLEASAVPPAPGRAAIRDSLFNYLGRDTNRLLQRVSGDERRKLEGYLDAMNSLGDRIMNAPAVDLLPSEIPDRPASDNPFLTEVETMTELIRLSFKIDSHRVAVLGLGQGVNDWSWTDASGQTQVGNIYGSDFHHEVAHHGV
ncbi:MAG: DUF1552 domain-containing protein, partial [Myxococcota bacterium]